MFAFKFFITFAATFASVSAVAVRSTKIVVRPKITKPTASEQWPIASTQTVTWDTSSIPPEAQNQTGLILLGYVEPGNTDEHLDAKHPLAAGFPIVAGAVNVTVPVVIPRDDYIVVLFGDSGNVSPKFSITVC